ncbi:UNVERIFIED_CONTAM: hypothetical protein Sangu_1440400 [Sesamum angustifolium]|uniref:SWIM-type domain-containing protein n=1 Tax=Sesamum angustifolium TaxID=2727405 RepID=A0AAW2N7R0_9LAMI
MSVANDNDVMSMFSRNYRHSEFDLFVEIANIVANDDGDEGGDSESGDKEDQGSGDGDGNDDEDDGMSDYCSDDHCEIFNESDEEFVDDHLKGCLNGDAVEFPNATGRKIVFEKGMIFTDVDALREFVIQEGFRMKRYRNETQRVTGGLSALRDGFITGCNPFIKFDGCHLKGPFGGVLLATIGLDGNNGLFPIAFSITEMKCKESWLFFFENLSNLLGGFSHDRPWTFMSDQQKAARSYDVVGFNFAMYKVKELKPTAYDWLLKIPVEQWSRHAFDPRLKNDHVTNNISESFNHWVGELRSKPVLTLLDGLRAKLMSHLQKQREKALKWSNFIVPNVVKVLNDARDESRNCKLLVADQFQFEVQDGNVHYVVNLAHRTCDCRVWDIRGIPCRHVALGITYRRDNTENFTDNMFTNERYMGAYNYFIHPIPGLSFWPQDVDVNPTSLKPPISKRLPGKPKKSRRKEPRETTVVKRSNLIRRKKCNRLGHNSRTCTGPQVLPTTEARCTYYL